LPIDTKELLTTEQIREEQIFLGLRSNGIEINLLNEKQINFMKECIKMGYAVQESNKFILTSVGRFITDSIVLKII
jgi:coproporphyrinogen III oxidase-like Fe-S oxidoreductase